MKTTTKTLSTIEIDCDSVDFTIYNKGDFNTYTLSAYERESGCTLVINIGDSNMRAIINKLWKRGYIF
jgi:hypothetical protein